MGIKKATIAVALMMLTLAASMTQSGVMAVAEGFGGEIDVFTQKTPYNGKGLNQPSDAYGLEEKVVLYALVTFYSAPISDLLVAFNVKQPNDVSLGFTEKTNASGIATIEFTIPVESPDVTRIFGEWEVTANVVMGGYVLQDTLTFRVDWIVKLLSVRTIDGNLSYVTSFGKKGDVGLEISVRNIAMTGRNATLAVVIQDEMLNPVNALLIRDFYVPPNDRLVKLYCKLYLPEYARVGPGAKAHVSAFTAPVSEGGVAYCPSISAAFRITIDTPLSLSFRDVAVEDIVTSATQVQIGQLVNIRVTVQNEGTQPENITVSVYRDSTLIAALSAGALAPHSQKTLTLVFNSSLAGVGSYRISASTPLLTGEAETQDNSLIDGLVTIEPKPPETIHDVAVTNVKPAADTVIQGASLQIHVTVVNKGTETETFSVSIYSNFLTIKTLQVNALPPNMQATLIFIWNTYNVAEDYYQIIAHAELDNDATPLDNTYVDGVVHVKQPVMIHDVAVSNVSTQSTTVRVGETVDVHVTVRNLGNYTETFTVTAYCNQTVIGTQTVNNLPADTEKTLIYKWSLQNIEEGNYTLSARADPVPEEYNLQNNLYIDGTVQVTTMRLEGWPLSLLLLLILLLLLLLLLAILLAAAFRRRRKKKKTEKAFNNAWTAWYYNHDRNNRDHQI